MASFSNDPLFAEHLLPLTAPESEAPLNTLLERPSVSDAALREHADALSRRWRMAPVDPHHTSVGKRLESLKERLDYIVKLCRKTASPQRPSPELEILKSLRTLKAALVSSDNTVTAFALLPRIQVEETDDLPRVMDLVEGYLSAANGIWSPESLTVYVKQAQKFDALQYDEIMSLPQALKLAQLAYILDRAEENFAVNKLPPVDPTPLSDILYSMKRLSQFEWRSTLEPLIAFDSILRQDPANVFAYMEDETRRDYHIRVAELAARADASEVETVQIALTLAREASRIADPDPRHARRTMHIGYYLFAEGFSRLSHQIGYHPPPKERIRSVLKRWNEDFYILGAFILSVALIVAIIAPLVPHHAFWSVMGALLLALLPATQGGVDLINNSVTALLKAQSLPKLDYSKGVPKEATTLVAVPTLLLETEQVRELCDELEARYLSNQDPNIHFGLLTDLADSIVRPLDEDRNPLVELAIRYITELNEKYAHAKGGSFFLLHRHRVFNSRQGVWMGWERKRGKLLDLNQFLLHSYDSFPIKAGPVQALNEVRYVITLDSDTQLPRGTAARMAGTMAHPLNQAIIDPRRRIVVAGYGILQPRVGVSVSSASRSRMASLYSGETGYDIYTRAVSDVYQDLFDEGIFTGKGIYDVSTLHHVLDRRFPRNALLSHDLIEGSYARAGLVTDIEIIDDYPSHYSAHTRRKHRWVRGDWQIAQWLFTRVPDETGKYVPNPISTISRWKIFDNLRRSLVEPVTFLMLLLGWFILPGGALYWTIATLVLLLLPVLVQLCFNIGRALLKPSFVGIRESLITFSSSFGFTLINLTFLPHQMLLSLDAIARTLIRRLVSGNYLLEWETAAQSEAGKTRTTLDIYLQLSPVVAILIGLALASVHLPSFFAAAPVLLLWMLAPLVVLWLNSPPRRREGPLTASDRQFLQEQVLHIWRYFLEFGDEKNHWLIPDNVEEKDSFQVRKLSPTNLGMLFNARQVAHEFGLLTPPEYARLTLGTLMTYDRLEKQNGHIYNWYDLESLRPIPPFIVSTVDSGNLEASLYTLRTGTLEMLKQPILSDESFSGLEMLQASVFPDKAKNNGSSPATNHTLTSLREHVRGVAEDPAAQLQSPYRENGRPMSFKSWAAIELDRRRVAVASFLEDYTPWLLPEFEALFSLMPLNGVQDQAIPTLEDAPAYAAGLYQRVTSAISALPESSPHAAAANKLRALLPQLIERLNQLKADILRIADEAERHADAMDYSFLLAESRQLLSISYDRDTGELYPSCYNLMASESRIATFLAVAKGDIPQQAWFRLDRSHVLVKGRPVLLSWTGTMFEYMMPTLWMRNYPNTLLSCCLESVVHIQREYEKGIPWGISESGYAKTDSFGHYLYQPWGIPQLALKYGAEDGPIISPYSSFLAIPIQRAEAIANLKRMASMDWVGAYGFYEAADYSQGKQAELVRSWMSHHQGMSLLAITNLMKDGLIQRWFHGTPLVHAAELLLHEKQLSREVLKDMARQSRLQTPASTAN